MSGFEPLTSGIGSDRSTNWATTTDQKLNRFDYFYLNIITTKQFDLRPLFFYFRTQDLSYCKYL